MKHYFKKVCFALRQPSAQSAGAIEYTNCISLDHQQIPWNGGARGVVVIAVGNEHGDTSSNPGRD